MRGAGRAVGTVTRTGFAEVREGLAGAGWEVLQAQPRSADHLLLQVREVGRRDVPAVPGQWFRDAGEAERVARRTAEVAPTLPDAVLRPTAHVVLQRAGVDRRLPSLAALLAAPGTELVAHRPERRAVVRVPRTAGDVYLKVLRPGRAAVAAGTLRHLAAAGLPVPRVVAVDGSGEAGVLALGALPGATLHALLAHARVRGGSVADDDLVAVGALVRRLHECPAPRGVVAHGPDDEVAVLDRARALAAGYGLGGPDGSRVAGVRDALRSLGAPARVVPLHRDLHDKQLLRDPATGSWSVLDLDLLAVGDPALDLANLLAHLELRALQGLLDPRLVEPWGEAVLAGYDADARTRAAIGPWQAAARLRLEAVYAFRPGGG